MQLWENAARTVSTAPGGSRVHFSFLCVPTVESTVHSPFPRPAGHRTVTPNQQYRRCPKRPRGGERSPDPTTIAETSRWRDHVNVCLSSYCRDLRPLVKRCVAIVGQGADDHRSPAGRARRRDRHPRWGDDRDAHAGLLRQLLEVEPNRTFDLVIEVWSRRRGSTESGYD